MKWLTRLFRRREVVRVFCPIVRTRAPLSPAEFAAIARSWADDDARLQVIEDLFDAQQSNLLVQISSPDVARETNGVIFLAGALESLRVMQEQLHTARKTPAPQAENLPH